MKPVKLIVNYCNLNKLLENIVWEARVDSAYHLEWSVQIAQIRSQLVYFTKI